MKLTLRVCFVLLKKNEILHLIYFLKDSWHKFLLPVLPAAQNPVEYGYSAWIYLKELLRVKCLCQLLQVALTFNSQENHNMLNVAWPSNNSPNYWMCDVLQGSIKYEVLRAQNRSRNQFSGKGKKHLLN